MAIRSIAGKRLLLCALLIGSLAATMTAVAYHDLRRAKEGIGVKDLVRVFE